MRTTGRKYLISLILSLFSCAIMAQTEGERVGADTISIPQEAPMAEPLIAYDDSNRLILPTLTSLGTIPTLWGYYPTLTGLNSWDVHEGLNVSLDASVFSTFGSGNTWSGAGFSQSVAMLYAIPLTQRLSMSVGGYFSNTSWAHSTWKDAGMTAVLGYQFDEHWSAYLYGQKSFIKNQPIPAHLMDMGDLGDRIGAAVRYTFNPNFAIQMSFDAGERPVYIPVQAPVLRRMAHPTHP